MLTELYRKHVPSAMGVVRGYSGGAFLEGNAFEADAAPFVCFTTSANKAEKILPETLKAIDACGKRPLFISMHLTNTQGDVATGEPAATATPTAAAAETPRRSRAAAPPSEVRGNERPEPNMERLAKENPAEYLRVRNKQRADARER